MMVAEAKTMMYDMISHLGAFNTNRVIYRQKSVFVENFNENFNSNSYP